jgi:hypothetical protein
MPAPDPAVDADTGLLTNAGQAVLLPALRPWLTPAQGLAIVLLPVNGAWRRRIAIDAGTGVLHALCRHHMAENRHPDSRTDWCFRLSDTGMHLLADIATDRSSAWIGGPVADTAAREKRAAWLSEIATALRRGIAERQALRAALPPGQILDRALAAYGLRRANPEEMPADWDLRGVRNIGGEE